VKAFQWLPQFLSFLFFSFCFSFSFTNLFFSTFSFYLCCKALVAGLSSYKIERPELSVLFPRRRVCCEYDCSGLEAGRSGYGTITLSE
jgi:hypothetical protein